MSHQKYIHHEGYEQEHYSPTEATTVTAATTFAGINKEGDGDGLSYDSTFNNDYDEYSNDDIDKDEIDKKNCENQK